jgi:hypothetical protein
MDALEQIRAVEEDKDETAEFLEEAGEVLALIARVVNSEGKDAVAVYERYKAIVSLCTRLHVCMCVHACSWHSLRQQLGHAKRRLRFV